VGEEGDPVLAVDVLPGEKAYGISEGDLKKSIPAS